MNLHRIFGVALVATVGAAVTLCVLHFKPRFEEGHRSLTQTVTVPAIFRSLRPTYPFSIIPGGVYNRGELQAQLRRDAVARDHYADFDVDKTRLVSSERDSFAYVSYRQHGRVFWTRNQMRIPKGELLLTDGRHLARTRCGNRLSDRKPVAAETSLTEPVAELTMPTASDSRVTDPRITFSEPPAGETQIAQTSFDPALPWQPKDLPFEWKPSTQSLSASPATPSLSNIMAAPFLFPPAGALGSTGSTSGTTTGTKTSTVGTTPGGMTPPGEPPLPMAPVAPVPEPAYTAVLAIALALLSRTSWLRAKRRTSL